MNKTELIAAVAEKCGIKKNAAEAAVAATFEAIAEELVKGGKIQVIGFGSFEVKDRAAMKFLDWYIDEQVEEEASVSGVLATLRLIGDDKNALLLLDKDLATRVFNPPVIG